MSPANRPELFSMESVGPMSENALERLYSWVDDIPLSRPKRNISRDFADGVLTAEIVKHFQPGIVDLHNYVPSSSTKAKEHNWYHLNRKVLSQLGLELDAEVIRKLVTCQPMVVECLLAVLRQKLDQAAVGQFSNDDNFMSQQYMPVSDQSPRRERKQYLNNERSLPAVWPDDRPEVDQQWRRGIMPVGNPHSNYSLPDYDDKRQQNAALASPKGLPPTMQQSSKISSYQGGLSPTQTRKQNKNISPKALLRQTEEELNMAKQTVEMLQAKTQKLEQLLQLKDIRIDDLTSRIQSLEQQYKAKNPPKKPVGNKYGK